MATTTRPITPPRAAAVAGIVFSALMGVSFVIIRIASTYYGSDPGKWLSDPVHRGAFLLALQLIPFAGIAFLWFIGVLRSRLGELEDQFFATVLFGSGLLFVACLFASAGVSAALVSAMADGHIGLSNSDTYYFARQLMGVLLNVFAIKMAGVFTMSSSTIMLRTGILPRWVAFLGFASAAILLLLITNWPWIVLLFPSWILIVSTAILIADLRSGQRKVVNATATHPAPG
ncbi:MAG: hypothetical protein ACJ74Z_16345 [Bryobacteraceae bacterium]